jgi:hypothetical protein
MTFRKPEEREISVCRQGRPLGGASGALVPGADFEGAPKGGHTLIRSTVAWSRWGRDFSYTSRPALGPTQPPVQWVPDLSRG